MTMLDPPSTPSSHDLRSHTPRETLDGGDHALQPPSPDDFLENLDPTLASLAVDVSQANAWTCPPPSATPPASLASVANHPGPCDPFRAIRDQIDAFGVQQSVHPPAAQALDDAISRNVSGLIGTLETKLKNSTDKLKASRRMIESLQALLKDGERSHEAQINELELQVVRLLKMLHGVGGLPALTSAEMAGMNNQQLIASLEDFLSSPSTSATTNPTTVGNVDFQMTMPCAPTLAAGSSALDVTMLPGPAPTSSASPGAVHGGRVQCSKCKGWLKEENWLKHVTIRCKKLFKGGQGSKYWRYDEVRSSHSATDEIDPMAVV